MHHRMATYVLQEDMVFNNRPVYVNYTKVWGKVFLYYDQTPDGLAYWVVGPKVGSSAVNLYAVSPAQSADAISAVWHVADPADHTFKAVPSIHIACTGVPLPVESLRTV